MSVMIYVRYEKLCLKFPREVQKWGEKIESIFLHQSNHDSGFYNCYIQHLNAILHTWKKRRKTNIIDVKMMNILDFKFCLRCICLLIFRIFPIYTAIWTSTFIWNLIVSNFLRIIGLICIVEWLVSQKQQHTPFLSNAQFTSRLVKLI